MQQIEISGNNNIYTAALNVVTGALSISNVTAFPLTKENLVSVYDTTTGSAFAMGPVLNFSWAYVQNNPVYTWQFGLPQIPAGAANGDTLKVIITIPVTQAVYSVNQKIANATV